MSVLDEFKGQLRESLRVVVRTNDGQIIRKDYRLYGADSVAAVLASGQQIDTWPMSWCLVPVGTDNAISLEQALDWIDEIGECNDGPPEATEGEV